MEDVILRHKNGNWLRCKPRHHSWYSNQTTSWTIWNLIPTKQDIFLFSKMSRLVLRPTQPPTERGTEVTTHLHLLLRVKMSGCVPLVPTPLICLHGMHKDNFLPFTVVCYKNCYSA
jgi:hypothetical protein